MSAGVEWAVHCCVVLSSMDEPLPVARLAEFHDVSRTYLAKQMQALSRAGIVRSVEGRDGGYVLARSPDQVSVLDVVRAVDGPQPAFRCTEIRQRGPLAASPEACERPCGVAVAMANAERVWRESLAAVSIGSLAGAVESGAPGTWRAVRSWAGEAAAQAEETAEP